MQKQGPQFNKRELDALRHIRNFIVHGKSPSVRDIQKALGYDSPRSAALLIDALIEKKVLARNTTDELQIIKDISARQDNAQTIEVPLVGSVPAGTPMLAEENLEAMIPVSKQLIKPGNRYFLIRVVGDSMNQVGMHSGDFVLVKQQQSAETGDIVVALIDDDATVKEYHRTATTIVLKPRSKNKEHKPIILTNDFQIQGVVVATIPNFED